MRGVEVTGFTQGPSRVDVLLSDGRTLRAQYPVGCDGGRNFVRKTAGIVFPGWDPTVSYLLAAAELTASPEWGLVTDDIGRHAFSRVEDSKVGILVTEREKAATLPPRLGAASRGGPRRAATSATTRYGPLNPDLCRAASYRL
jgi:2-polyprenyl-6-methoxyphenol hydroxylase-like FAD-dependent oxidoreductase